MIPSIRSSLSMAAEHDQARTHVIYSERGDVIGLTIYGVDETNQKWKIFRLFVDQSVQGQGVGTSAINMFSIGFFRGIQPHEVAVRPAPMRPDAPTALDYCFSAYLKVPLSPPNLRNYWCNGYVTF